MIRWTLYFTGHVQGVGFRYTTCQVAQRFAVAGFVRNLPDRRVELVVEGERPEVRAFIAAVNEALTPNIRSQTQDETPATGEFGEPKVGGLCIRH